MKGVKHRALEVVSPLLLVLAALQCAKQVLSVPERISQTITKSYSLASSHFVTVCGNVMLATGAPGSGESGTMLVPADWKTSKQAVVSTSPSTVGNTKRLSSYLTVHCCCVLIIYAPT